MKYRIVQTNTEAFTVEVLEFKFLWIEKWKEWYYASSLEKAREYVKHLQSNEKYPKVIEVIQQTKLESMVNE